MLPAVLALLDQLNVGLLHSEELPETKRMFSLVEALISMFQDLKLHQHHDQASMLERWQINRVVSALED